MAEAAPLWPGGPKFIPDPDFPLGTDALLLADFAAGVRARRALDLGCGAGPILLLLLEGRPELTACGLEVRPEAAALARTNLALNGLDARGEVREGDLREHRALFAPGGFDLVVCNPPYFSAGGVRSPTAGRAAARSGNGCTAEDVWAAAAWLCRPGGAFCLVHRAEALSGVLRGLSAAGLEPKRLRFAAHDASAPPSLFLAECRRGARSGLTVEPELFLRGPDGRDSAEMRRICRLDGAARKENR